MLLLLGLGACAMAGGLALAIFYLSRYLAASPFHKGTSPPPSTHGPKITPTLKYLMCKSCYSLAI